LISRASLPAESELRDRAREAVLYTLQGQMIEDPALPSGEPRAKRKETL
jgi:hypothetical protein